MDLGYYDQKHMNNHKAHRTVNIPQAVWLLRHAQLKYLQDAEHYESLESQQYLEERIWGVLVGSISAMCPNPPVIAESRFAMVLDLPAAST